MTVRPPPPHSRLDPILYRKCQGDAARLCYTQGWNETNENAIPSGAVFSCLYRHAYRSVEQGRRVSPLNAPPIPLSKGSCTCVTETPVLEPSRQLLIHKKLSK